MTESEKPERAGEPNFHPGPGKEHFEKFKIGPTEEELKKFRGPEWRSEVPDIRMELNPGEQADRDSAERFFGRSEGLGFLSEDLQRFSKRLEVLEEQKKREVKDEKPKDKLERINIERREVEKSSRTLSGEMLDRLDEVLPELERFKNPWPFDSRGPETWLKELGSRVKAFQNREWMEEGSESMEVTKATYLSALWGLSKQRVVVGAGAIRTGYYDHVREMSTLKDPYRSVPVAPDYRYTFKGKIPGLEIEDEEVKKYLKIEEKDNLLLRELAVKYQDESMSWQMLVAAAHQYDPTQPEDHRTFVSERFLTPTVREFIYEVFGVDTEKENGWVEYNGEKFPKKLLNYYVNVDTFSEFMRYKTTMEELLKGNYWERVLAIEGEDRMPDRGKLKQLAAEVRNKINERTADSAWDQFGNKLEDRLAEYIVRANIIENQGHLISGVLGWGWKFKKTEVKDNEGKTKLEFQKEMKMGSVYNAMDATTARYPHEHTVRYHGIGRKTSQVMLPSSKHWQETVLEGKESPYWVKNLSEAMRENDYLNRVLRLVFNGSKEDGLKFDPAVGKLLEQMGWAWETPYEGDRKREIVMPVFIPKQLHSINFWETLVLESQEEKEEREESEKITILRGDDDEKTDLSRYKWKKTAWEKLCQGTKLSELEWDEMHFMNVDYWHVSLEQSIRWYQIITGSTPDEVLEMFFKNTGGLTELIKRVDLGMRSELIEASIVDEKGEKRVIQIPGPVFEIAIVPYLITTSLIVKHNVFDPNEAPSRVDGWKEEMERWYAAIDSALPEEKKDMVYKDMMLRVFGAYYLLANRLVEKARRQEPKRKEGYDNLSKLKSAIQK